MREQYRRYADRRIRLPSRIESVSVALFALTLERRNEMPQQPTYTQSIQPCGHVVEDDAPAFRQAFKLPGGKRFRDIEKTEEDESQNCRSPIGAATQKRDPLAGNFVDDNEAGVVSPALARRDGRRRNAECYRKYNPNEQRNQQVLRCRMEAPRTSGPKQYCRH